MTGIAVFRATLLTTATAFGALGIFSSTTAACPLQSATTPSCFLRWHRRSHGSSTGQPRAPKPMPVFLSQPWLIALIPVGLAIMPINKLTILLLLVLAADVAVALLLVDDLRQYRLQAVPGELGSYLHRLRHWTAGAALSNEMTVNVAQIDELDNETMNARCTALISRYWARQGFMIELSSSQGAPLRSNLQPNGLPADYSGEDAIPINAR